MSQAFSVVVTTTDLTKCYIEFLANELGEEPGSFLFVGGKTNISCAFSRLI